MRVFLLVSMAFWALGSAEPLHAQWPGEIRGRVVDAFTDHPLATAVVRIDPGSRTTGLDGRGAFDLCGLEPGRYTVRASSAGYVTSVNEVVIENGRVTDLRIRLSPVFALEGVTARVDADPLEGFVLSNEDLRSLPGATAGDLMRHVPGVLLSSTGRGGSQTPSIRGSGGDAVLVLLDGVPINDPITGEADLSTIPAGQVASIQLLPGGRSARYGARAEGGVILMETRATERGGGAALTTGSLREVGVEADYGARLLGGTVDLGGVFHELGGGFDFDLPDQAGGGASIRDNADSRLWSARLGWNSDRTNGHLRVGLATEQMDRGLPGRSFAPSHTGRQTLRRSRAFASGERAGGAGQALRWSAHVMGQTTDVRDPDPGVGTPYDDRTTLSGTGAEIHGSTVPWGAADLAMGLAASHVRVQSTALDLGEIASRTDIGAWMSPSIDMGRRSALSASVRVDRSGFPTEWYLSHDLRFSARWSAVDFHMGHRSSFSPPTLGDQFFREGVGVEPNPDLGPERVPSEWVGGMGLRLTMERSQLSFDGEAYAGDVLGMIVWLPDYRFVWSPRNLDVQRRGVDLRTQIRWPSRGVDVRADWSWNHATYIRPMSSDVQLVYRPRFRGSTGASWSNTQWSGSLRMEFTGARFPVPNDVNELPSFWTTGVGVARRWRARGGSIEIRLDVDRLVDHKDALIFAYPDPGRTLRISLRWQRLALGGVTSAPD